MKVSTYLAPPLNTGFIGPITSLCTNSNGVNLDFTARCIALGAVDHLAAGASTANSTVVSTRIA